MSEKKLQKIAKGKYVKRLETLRTKAKITPPEGFSIFLNPAEVENAAEAQYARFAYPFEFLRNGMILLPLLVTWLSLGIAAFAYAQTYTTSPDPFLKQWADGFPLAHVGFPILSFVDTATIDVILILLLLVCTLVVQTIEGLARWHAADLRTWLDDELFGLISLSQVTSLGEGPDNKKPAWAVEVHSAINHLNQALKGVETLVDSSQQTLENLVRTSQATLQNIMEASQTNLEGSVREFRGAIRSQQTSVEALVNSSQQTLKSLVDTSQTALKHLVDASQDKLEGSVRGFSMAISDQRDAVDKFMRGINEVRRVVDKLETIYVEGEHIYQGLNAMLPNIDHSFKVMATSQGTTVTVLESLGTHTNQAADAIGAIAAQFTETQLVQSTYQAAVQMRKTAELMGDIAARMGETVNRQTQFHAKLEQLTSQVQPETTRGSNAPLKKKSWLEKLFT